MVWLIGCNGMLGKETAELLEKENIEFTGTDREIDITDPSALDSFADNITKQGKALTHIINCAGYTNVDKAESDTELCRALNAAGSKNIALTAKKYGAKLIHISTDYVFDGKAHTPYTENSPANPDGVYAKTKFEGEKAIQALLPNYYIIRTAWLYGKYGKNFVFTMLKLMKEQKSLKVVNDQYGTPTYAADLAKVLVFFVKKTGIPYGTYHFTNLGETNWFEFAQQIQRSGLKYNQLEKESPLSPCSTSEYTTPASRPAYSVLDKSKISSVLDWTIPRWQQSLETFIKGL